MFLLLAPTCLTFFAATTEVDIEELLPDAPRVTGALAAASSSARQHAHLLEQSSAHEARFWVRGLFGDPAAERVVFLIPQYHRDDTVPLSWTTLGREIAEVQMNIDALVRRLALAHATTCVGTEGDTRTKIRYSSELAQLSRWLAELRRGRAAAMAALDETAETQRQSIETIVRILSEALRTNAAYLDGVGAAQARLGQERPLVRFGVEDKSTNQRALDLLVELRAVERELAKLKPSSQPAEGDVLGQMWLHEYPRYEADTLVPLEKALATLDAARLELRRDGLTEAARTIARFATRARRISAAIIRPEQVRANIEYYRQLDRAADVPRQPTRPSSRAQTKRWRRLQRRYQALSSEFSRVSLEHREQVAARILLERLQRHQRCVLVMGAGHEQGLIQAIESEARKRNLWPIGIVVIAPFNFAQSP